MSISNNPASSRLPGAVVMTSTVTPAKSMIGSVRNDPASRLEEYCQAFEFYLAMPDDQIDMIVVLENSDADLSVFDAIAKRHGTAKKIHLINTSSTYPGEMGKGYGEFLMIDEGLSKIQSTGVPAGKVFWKVTGRLKVLNFDRLIETSPPSSDIYCDLRDVPLLGNSLGGNKWMELRIFSFTLPGYDRYLRGKYDLGIGLEFYFFEIMHNALNAGSDSRIVPRFKVQPILDGFCGYNNKSYLSLEYRLKNLLRSAFRVFLPRVWL